jgi:hypothetical protein
MRKMNQPRWKAVAIRMPKKNVISGQAQMIPTAHQMALFGLGMLFSFLGQGPAPGPGEPVHRLVATATTRADGFDQVVMLAAAQVANKLTRVSWDLFGQAQRTGVDAAVGADHLQDGLL